MSKKLSAKGWGYHGSEWGVTINRYEGVSWIGMYTPIKSGDCVEIKHGGNGIKMTVDFIFDYQGRERAQCKWFNTQDHKFEELSVDVTALKLCDS